MNPWLLCLLAFSLSACAGTPSNGGSDAAAPTVMPALCSADWNHWVEGQVSTGDGQGHGPDIGSAEWRSVVEFKLGLSKEPGLAPSGSETWCRQVNETLLSRHQAMSAKPSFDCQPVAAGSIEALICQRSELAALDRQLAEVYRAAKAKAANQHPAMLTAEQRGWIKGRNDCWKSTDQPACVRDAYQHRIAELQARYQLLKGRGPFRFVCAQNPANEVLVTFYATTPATLLAEHGDQTSLMYIAPSGSGSRYLGRNESFWEHQGQARIRWGYGAEPMRCVKANFQ